MAIFNSYVKLPEGKDKIHHHQLRMAQTTTQTTQVLHPLEGGSLVMAHLFHQGIGQMIIHDLPKPTCN